MLTRNIDYYSIHFNIIHLYLTVTKKCSWLHQKSIYMWPWTFFWNCTTYVQQIKKINKNSFTNFWNFENFILDLREYKKKLKKLYSNLISISISLGISLLHIAQFLVVLAIPFTQTIQKTWPHSRQRGRVMGPKHIGHSSVSRFSSPVFSIKSEKITE